MINDVSGPLGVASVTVEPAIVAACYGWLDNPGSQLARTCAEAGPKAKASDHAVQMPRYCQERACL